MHLRLLLRRGKCSLGISTCIVFIGPRFALLKAPGSSGFVLPDRVPNRFHGVRTTPRLGTRRVGLTRALVGLRSSDCPEGGARCACSSLGGNVAYPRYKALTRGFDKCSRIYAGYKGGVGIGGTVQSDVRSFRALFPRVGLASHHVVS